MSSWSRFTHRERYTWPMFTSCCPGWVRFLKSQFPDYTDNLSTAKMSPADVRRGGQELLCREDRCGPQAHFRGVHHALHRQKERVRPCPPCGPSATIPDVDVVLTTREIVPDVPGRADQPRPPWRKTPFDSPLGTGTGAAVIFGATGGVMDAALRSAYYLVTGYQSRPGCLQRRSVGGKPWKEAVFTIPRRRRHLAWRWSAACPTPAS